LQRFGGAIEPQERADAKERELLTNLNGFGFRRGTKPEASFEVAVTPGRPRLFDGNDSVR